MIRELSKDGKRIYTMTTLSEWRCFNCVACGETSSYLPEEEPVRPAVCRTCKRELDEMPRLHDLIGRRMIAGDVGFISASILQWRPMSQWQPVLDEMGLEVRDGQIRIVGDTFEDGWDFEANQWKPSTCALYRFYDAAGVLLYIGISGRIHERMKQHSMNASWFEVAARVEIEHLPNRKAALDAERAAIKAERPLHNVVHALRPTPLVMPPKKPRSTP